MTFSDTLTSIKRLFERRSTATETESKSVATPFLKAGEGMCIHEVAVAGIQHNGREHVTRRLTLMEQISLRRDRENLTINMLSVYTTPRMKSWAICPAAMPKPWRHTLTRVLWNRRALLFGLKWIPLGKRMPFMLQYLYPVS